MNLLVIIPAFNEEENIPFVSQDIGELKDNAILIDDGSTDRTLEVSRKEGFNTISLPFNTGIGGVMQTGFRYAIMHGYDIAVQFDGDGQHRRDQIERIIKPVVEGRADIVIGSRLHEGDYRFPFLRLLGIKWFSFLLRILTGKKVSDVTSGFRCYGRNAIEVFKDHYPVDYPEVESLLFAIRKGLRIVEVSVKMRERVSGRSSITPFKAIYYMVKVSLGLLIGAMMNIPKREVIWI